MVVVLAVDIGLRNLAHCLLRCPGAPPQVIRAPTTNPSWVDSAALLASGAVTVQCWEVLALCPPATPVRRLSDGAVCEQVVAYFTEHRALYEQADVVVIEQQRTARMRLAAAALQALVLHLGRRVHLQHGGRKLAWAGLPPGVTTRTYHQRKRLAVELCAAAVQHPAFAASRKKDDLADALLHALWFACALCRSSIGSC